MRALDSRPTPWRRHLELVRGLGPCRAAALDRDRWVDRVVIAGWLAFWAGLTAGLVLAHYSAAVSAALTRVFG